jgi:hypothetical protein
VASSGYLQQLAYPAADDHFARPYSTIYASSRLWMPSRKMSAQSSGRAFSRALSPLQERIHMHIHELLDAFTFPIAQTDVDAGDAHP